MTFKPFSSILKSTKRKEAKDMRKDHTEKANNKRNAHARTREAKSGGRIGGRFLYVPKKLLFKTENLKTRFINAT